MPDPKKHDYAGLPPHWPAEFLSTCTRPADPLDLPSVKSSFTGVAQELLDEIRALRADQARDRLQAEYDRLTAAFDFGTPGRRR